MSMLVCRETYGSHSDPRDYVREDDGHVYEAWKNSRSRRFSSVFQLFRTVFLPQGYPDSVSRDYMQYQIWDTIQAFCSSISGTLSTHAMLKGVGVGDETATAAAATITWLLRDGTSMTGRIVFAWYQGSSLDSDAKRWRLFADIMNDAAIFIELVSGLFPQFFILIACISSLFKSMVGVAGGATRAALTMHQARRNNMADVSAKDGSQETLVNLAALLMGLLITPLAAGNFMLTWCLFLICTGGHLYANYRAVTCVVMETLNQTRLHILSQDYLHSSQPSLLGPESVNKKEPVVWRLVKPLEIHIGSPFSTVVKTMREFETCLQANDQERYLLKLDMKKGNIDIVVHHTASSEDIIKACFQAEIIMQALSQPQAGYQGSYLIVHGLYRDLTAILQKGSVMNSEDCWDVVQLSHQICSATFPRFLHDLGQAGWVIGHSQLGVDEWRATWTSSGMDLRKTF
ncbi:RUS family member 1-like [Diadema setosum]|uniref:RUS family member 1-like n=1 Tax=Diadema setosum TaxID=31175 RepID=UPI003B3AB44A